MLTSKQAEKNQCEDAGAGQIGFMVGAGIGHLTEDMDQMGKIVLHKNLRDGRLWKTIRIKTEVVEKKIKN